MIRIVILIILLMGAVFVLVTNIIAERSGRRGVDPVAAISRGVTSTLNDADKLVPDLAGALSRAEIDIPKIGARKTEPDLAMAMQDFSGADFSGQNRQKAIFAGARLARTAFVSSLLDEAVFEGAQGRGANFNKAHLTRANLNASLFENADFSDANLAGATARAAVMAQADFSGADLTRAKFSAADAAGAQFAGAQASGAIFAGAQLQDAVFIGADLTGARFPGADLTGANFAGARIEGADFTGARIDGADLSAVVGAGPEQFIAACANAATRLPAGASPAACSAQ